MTFNMVIAIDDTDMPGTRGTGRLAREIGAALEADGMARLSGVTRHQFHVGPGVPMTSHNSAAALSLETDRIVGEIESIVAELMMQSFIPGSDPGLAVLDAPAPPEIVSFARRAQTELVTLDEAERLASVAGLRVVGLGGTRQGMIGAMSAAALRWEGNDGRFVGLPAIRDLLGRVPVGEVLARAPIDAVVEENGWTALDPIAILDTCDWVRPRLVAGRAVVVARATGEPGVWINVDRRTHED